MDFTPKNFKKNSNNINNGIKPSQSPFRKSKAPTKSVRIRLPMYKKLRKYAFLEECPMSQIMDSIVSYGMHYYERYHKLGKYHK